MSKKQDTPPTILLVEPDDETRSLLSYNLRNQGYRVIVALDQIPPSSGLRPACSHSLRPLSLTLTYELRL